jgi:uncharacterized protein
MTELIAMPTRTAELLRVEPFVPFEEAGRRLVFVVDNTAFVEADDAAWALAEHLGATPRVDRAALVRWLAERFGQATAEQTVEAFRQLEILRPADWPRVRPSHPASVITAAGTLLAPSSLVLHVAHDCNLRCGYCYADFGRYGSDAGMMTEAQAEAHVDRFFDALDASDAGAPGPQRRPVHVTFFGGEPLMNMPVVYAGHARAKARAQATGRPLAWGLTTNGTLLTDEHVAFFDRERFTVTVSIDGPPDVNDRLRPIEGGGGSYAKIMERVAATGLRPVARVTLTKRATDVRRIVMHLVEAGFREVGVSPVTTGSNKFDMGPEELAKVLEGMRALADEFVAWAKQGRLLPFSNLRGMLEQVGSGEPRGLPCGAGTNLVAADNKGDLYACHRLVGDDNFKIGTLDGGYDEPRRLALFRETHPATRAPCEQCWARYLCGGGCHHIAYVQSEKAPAPWTLSNDFCDFLRAWYRLGLTTYARIADEAPAMLGQLRGVRAACSQPSGL